MGAKGGDSITQLDDYLIEGPFASQDDLILPVP